MTGVQTCALPISNFDRAVKFYSDILGTELQKTNMMGLDMAFFPAEDGVGGAVVSGEGYAANENGSVV